MPLFAYHVFRLRIRAHGLTGYPIHDVIRATLIGRAINTARLGGDFSPWLTGPGSNLSLKSPMLRLSIPATSLMSPVLSMLLKQTYSVPYCVTQTTFSTN